MPATVTGGKLDPAKNRVRTSNSLQGNAMWQSVIGMDSQQGGNAAVEKLIAVPATKRSHQTDKKSRQEAAAEAMKLTKNFDTSVTDYDSLLTLAKSQGCLGNEKRGACKICGQVGHLTKQCRNQFSKFYADGTGGGQHAAGASGGYELIGADMGAGKKGEEAGGGGYASDGSLSSLSSLGDEKERGKETDRADRREREKKRRKKERKEKKERKDKKEKKERKDKKEKRRRHDDTS